MSEISKIVESIRRLNTEDINLQSIASILEEARLNNIPVYSVFRIINSRVLINNRSLLPLNREGWIYVEPDNQSDLRLKEYIFKPAFTGWMTELEKHHLYSLGSKTGIAHEDIDYLVEQILQFKGRLSGEIDRIIEENLEKAKLINRQNNESFTDPRDGKTYKLIKIGFRVWMAENLAWMPSVSPSIEGSDNYPYYYVYGYDGKSIDEAKLTTNYMTLGALYNWPAAKIASPPGWRLPTVTELEQLYNFLGSAENAGGKMKSKTGWLQPNEGATNLSGFSALPGGARGSNGIFSGIESSADFWIGTEYTAEIAFSCLMSHLNAKVFRNKANKDSGFSVRCIRD